MKRLIELANQIKDKELREKTIKLLQEPEISDSEIIYPAEKFDKIPAWVGAHHNYKGGQLEHTINVVKISLAIAKQFEEMYNAKINKDHLISGALLHDIMKVFILKKSGKGWDLTGTLLDHADFSACELYARDFPEEVVHIVAAHGGDTGAAYPRTLEALIVYYADVIDAAGEGMIRGVPELKLLLMPQSEEE
ncbi:MAG: HD domain-containing protein [Candidatus Aenigmatarchaeota archaeon]